MQCKMLIKYETYNIIPCLYSFFSHQSIATGQINTIDAPQVLEKLYGRLVNNFDDIDRIQINDSIILIIDSYVSPIQYLTTGLII